MWAIIWSQLLFVVAPHLDLISKRAARTVRVASFAPLASVLVPTAAHLGRLHDHVAVEVLQPLLVAVFWGLLALAAVQLVQGAPPKQGGSS